MIHRCVSGISSSEHEQVARAAGAAAAAAARPGRSGIAVQSRARVRALQAGWLLARRGGVLYIRARASVYVYVYVREPAAGEPLHSPLAAPRIARAQLSLSWGLLPSPSPPLRKDSRHRVGERRKDLFFFFSPLRRADTERHSAEPHASIYI